LLAACATERFDGAPCPPVVDYSGEFLVRAADELASLPAGSAIEQMLDDYQVMRDQARACGQNPLTTEHANAGRARCGSRGDAPVRAAKGTGGAGWPSGLPTAPTAQTTVCSSIACALAQLNTR
jgi:hypothetical protein